MSIEGIASGKHLKKLLLSNQQAQHPRTWSRDLIISQLIFTNSLTTITKANNIQFNPPGFSVDQFAF